MSALRPIRNALALVGAASVFVGCRACSGAEPSATVDAGPEVDAAAKLAALRPQDAGPKPGAPRAGMAFVPAGTLKAGTPLGKLPRVATEELPGTPIQMGAYYIDIYPYPNEPGAIPQPNVSRDEAKKLCAEKGKRLCTELEWERACKGPDNTTYEYGETYRSALCMTGQSAELASRKPCGERPSCRSGFGVLEMHGGAWEWTDSTWGRGTHDPNLAVLRGGNAEAGEIVGRCANAIGRPASKKHPTFGFRCCAGERNDAEVVLDPHTTGKTLTMLVKPEERAAKLVPLLDKGQWGGDVAQLEVDRAWLWQPVPNEDLVVFGGCTPEGISRKCGFVVGRTPEGGEARVVAQLAFPRAMPEMKTSGDPLRIRAIAVDIKGRYFIEFSYSYGKVSVGAPVRLSEGQGLDPKTPAP